MRTVSCLLTEPFNLMAMSQLMFFQDFLSLIQHLCQNLELVLTEHTVLCRSELVLTTTSSHHVYTCTHSETTPELIAKK